MKPIHYIVFISLIISVFSCGKLIDEFYRTSEEKAQIPFNGFETITFIDTDSNYIIIQAEDRFDEVYESPECINCRDYSIFERTRINLSNNLYGLNLSIGSGSRKNYFSLSFGMDGEGFGCGLISPLSKKTLRDTEVFYDSINTSIKTYYNIFSDTLTHTGMIEIDPYPVRCYYSTGYGVVKIDFSDSTSWELEHIEW
jgi:hypothetical protein